MGQKGQRRQYIFMKALAGQIIDGYIRVFNHVMEQGGNDGVFIGHGFGQMHRVVDIGKPGFIHLSGVGVIGDTHGFTGHRGVDHGLILFSVIPDFPYKSRNGELLR